MVKVEYYCKDNCYTSTVFSSYGKAIDYLMKTYHYKYSLNTISKVLHRFAPLSENNTYAYIANVCKWMTELYDFSTVGYMSFYVTENDVFCWFINPHQPSFACRCLAKAIFLQECGYECSDETIDKAIALL